jgi:hypothetical protein
VIQLVIVTVLMFVLFFGIGFILNMLMKTTWFPIYAYLALIVGLMVYWASSGSGSLWENLSGFTYVDYLAGVGGLIGAVLSGSAIRTLRIKGFKMF